MLDAPMGIVIGTVFLYDLLGTRIGLWFSVIFECFFFRCLLLHRSRRNMSIPSHEPLCWKSGRWCVIFIYLPELLWYLPGYIYIYSCSRKSDEGSRWASRTHEWSTLVFDSFRLLRTLNEFVVWHHRFWVESVCSKCVEGWLLSEYMS